VLLVCGRLGPRCLNFRKSLGVHPVVVDDSATAASRELCAAPRHRGDVEGRQPQENRKPEPEAYTRSCGDDVRMAVASGQATVRDPASLW